MQAKLGLLVLLALVLSPAEAVVQADIGNLCTTFTKNTLKADILDCFMENALPVNDEHTYTVAVPPAANFDLSVVLRSMRGDADL